MTTNYYGGTHVKQNGNRTIGVINCNLQGETQAALNQLVKATKALRDQVGSQDRQTIDESLEVISTSGGNPGILRSALTKIAGIAAVVGEVGAPVIKAVRNVIDAFG